MLAGVPSLTELVRAHTDLDAEDVAWLQLLLADWQIIADLSFADLVLWLPDRDGTGYWAVAQMRSDDRARRRTSTTWSAPSSPKGRRPLIDSAHEHQRVAREGDPEWRDDIPVRVEAIPVRRGDRILGIIARNTNLLGVRTPSRLELAYLQTATDLTQMIAGGHFPFPGQRSDHADSPRVGDGFLRIDAAGRVTYASPNALSVYRRLGLSADLTGLDLAETTSGRRHAVDASPTFAPDASKPSGRENAGHRWLLSVLHDRRVGHGPSNHASVREPHRASLGQGSQPPDAAIRPTAARDHGHCGAPFPSRLGASAPSRAPDTRWADRETYLTVQPSSRSLQSGQTC